ncbi:hypothetical protein M2132_000852 [Dysgonomonas sp. PH5-45]|nr:hypothetical protein [Dysgonomonas sp. PH5-45]MDH6387420.1 hypothetical protein [Dysgonomonas sp. PH5-37]
MLNDSETSLLCVSKEILPYGQKQRSRSVGDSMTDMT